MRDMRIEFTVGKTKHAQPLRLVAERKNGAEFEFSLFRDAINQRDETAVIYAIPEDALKRIADAAHFVKQIKS